jgi:succinate-acetate transporter protein
MSEEMKIKVAMPDVLGLLLVSFIALMVGLVSLGVGNAANAMGMVFAFLPYAALLFLIVTVACYLNENMFGTALFGVLTVFFYGLPVVVSGAPGFTDIALFVLFGAVFLLAMTGVSLAQPVKMVTGVIILAALTFLFLGVWLWTDFTDASSIWGTLTGIFGVLAGLLSLYLPLAILYNTMKGQNTLPLM